MCVKMYQFIQFKTQFEDVINQASHHQLKTLSKLLTQTTKKRYPRYQALKCELIDKGFTIEEFKKFLSVVDDEKIKACYLIMAYLGLRVGELVGLKKADLKNNKLVISSLKGGYGSYLTLPGALLDLIRKYEEKGTKLIDITDRQLRYAFDFYRKKAGLNEVYAHARPAGKNKNFTKPLYRFSLHSLRHFGIQQVYDKSKDPELARKFARHRKIQTTLNYFRKNKAQEVEDIIASFCT